MKETQPLLDYYKEKDMLKIVDSSNSNEIVFENIEQILTGERQEGCREGCQGRSQAFSRRKEGRKPEIHAQRLSCTPD